ncbi:MAG TPA: branched-chain amino acid ABC transporter permease, partial [Chloroflexota bacterium]|nr:branched-chain amino acid ABC transporter permease [Chloroflexota bacterium]
AGLTFIYGVMRILNVAHGSLYGLGAYMGAWLVLRLWPGGSGPLPPAWSYLVLLLGAVFIGVTVGPLLERVFIRRVADRGEVIPLILTFALFLILEDVMKLIWGVDPYLADMPYSRLGSISLAGVSYPVYQCLLPLVALAAAGLLWFVINRTRFGKLVIAVIADREVSAALGVNVPRVYTFAFTLGAILAAVGGAFVAPMGSVVPGISVEVIILAFAVTTIGGLGSVPGAAIGAILVGLLRAVAVQRWPEFDLFVVYALMALILLIRPRGLFGGLEVRRI